MSVSARLQHDVFLIHDDVRCANVDGWPTPSATLDHGRGTQPQAIETRYR
jgi:hypothetical protein